MNLEKEKRGKNYTVNILNNGKLTNYVLVVDSETGEELIRKTFRANKEKAYKYAEETFTELN